MSNNYEARARDVNLESITSSEQNKLILEQLRNNDDEFKFLGIVGGDYDDWIDDDDFEVKQGDNVGWLGYFIGKSKRLESLWISHLPGDDSFRQGLAQNQSIQKLFICDDLGKAGFQTLANISQNIRTLEEIHLQMSITSPECAQNIALLFSRCQIRNLKRLAFDENDISDEGFEVVAHSLRGQSQLEELSLSFMSISSREDAPSDFDQSGYVALGATMKKWISPSLNKLRICNSDLHDDGLLALVEGMANCVNLEHLNLIRGHGSITVVGLTALSSLFRSKKFCLRSFDVSDMLLDDVGMNILAAGVASIPSMQSLNLKSNAIGDEGLQSLAVGVSNNKNLETLNLSNNGPFSEIGLRHLSDVIPKVLNLKELYLSSNSISEEGLQTLAVGLRKHPALERLDLSSNAIGSDGLRALATAEITSLRSLNLARNAINDEALGVFVEGIENFVNLETLDLTDNNMITPSGLAVLAPIFHRESCSLKEIDLYPTNLEDREAIAFAEGLVGNESLTDLLLDYKDITALGWSAFSTLLCDTSSVNNTYLSNHTLEVIGHRHIFGGMDRIHLSVQTYLLLNRQNEYDVPTCKILMSHSNLDMTPCLQWKLKLLPFVLAWFERAQSCRTYLEVEESIAVFERRELSALYQFIRGLPLLAASGFYKQMSTEALSKKRKFDQCDK